VVFNDNHVGTGWEEKHLEVLVTFWEIFQYYFLAGGLRNPH